MADKKTTNLAPRVEWPQSADRTTALDEFGGMSEECAKAASTLIEGASNEPIPVDPGLLEGLQSALEDAKQALDEAEFAAEDELYGSVILGVLSTRFERIQEALESAMRNVAELMEDQNG